MMNSKNRNEILFDALVEASAADALSRELEAMPSNEELNAQYAASPGLDRRIHRQIEQAYRKTKRRKARRSALRVAAGIAIVFTVMSVVLLSVQATRIKIFNIVTELHDDYTQVQYVEPSEVDTGALYRITYLPDGFSEISSDGQGTYRNTIYQNADGVQIIFIQQKAQSVTANVDSEHSAISQINIKGSEAYLFQASSEGDANVLMWSNPDGISLSLLSTINSDELVKIAQGIEKE